MDFFGAERGHYFYVIIESMQAFQSCSQQHLEIIWGNINSGTITPQKFTELRNYELCRLVSDDRELSCKRRSQSSIKSRFWGSFNTGESDETEIIYFQVNQMSNFTRKRIILLRYSFSFFLNKFTVFLFVWQFFFFLWGQKLGQVFFCFWKVKNECFVLIPPFLFLIINYYLLLFEFLNICLILIHIFN